jgi:hypothetical protein
MSIDHELAKELKHGGFPQSNKQGAWWFDEHKTLFIQATTYGVEEANRTSDCVRVPNLEELIAAVERDGWFGFSLEHNHLTHEWDAWIIENAGNKSLVEATALQSGPTPAEAVAMLWLALNPKI